MSLAPMRCLQCGEFLDENGRCVACQGESHGATSGGVRESSPTRVRVDTTDPEYVRVDGERTDAGVFSPKGTSGWFLTGVTWGGVTLLVLLVSCLALFALGAAIVALVLLVGGHILFGLCLLGVSGVALLLLGIWAYVLLTTRSSKK